MGIATRVLGNIIEPRQGRPAPVVSISYVSLEDKGQIVSYPYCRCTSSNYYKNTVTVIILNPNGTPQMDDKNKPIYRCLHRSLIINLNNEEVLL